MKEIRLSAAVWILTFFMMIFNGMAYAGQDVLEVILPVEVRVSGKTTVQRETGTVRLKAEESAPMPENNSKTFDLKVAGTEKSEFPAIRYDRAGVYRYTVSELSGKNPKVQYDKRTYEVTVTISNSKNGEGLQSAVAVRCNNMKTDEVKFLNKYLSASSDKNSSGTVNTSSASGSGRLIQTGQLNWPIPVLSVLGLIVFFSGTAGLLRNKEDEE